MHFVKEDSFTCYWIKMDGLLSRLSAEFCLLFKTAKTIAFEEIIDALNGKRKCNFADPGFGNQLEPCSLYSSRRRYLLRWWAKSRLFCPKADVYMTQLRNISLVHNLSKKFSQAKRLLPKYNPETLKNIPECTENVLNLINPAISCGTRENARNWQHDLRIRSSRTDQDIVYHGIHWVYPMFKLSGLDGCSYCMQKLQPWQSEKLLEDPDMRLFYPVDLPMLSQ